MTAVLKYSDEKAADKAFRLCRLQKLGYHWLSAAEMRDVRMENSMDLNSMIDKYNYIRNADRDHQLCTKV